jgi:hypothetical protein
MRGCSAESPNSALPFQSVCAQWGGSYLASRWYRTAEQNAAEVGNGDSHHSYKTLAAAITALRYFDNFTRKKAAGIRGQGRTPLFRSTIGKTGILTGLQAKIGYHTFRATGITAYLEAGGTLEDAQATAAHGSPRTTKLYDRTADVIALTAGSPTGPCPSPESTSAQTYSPRSQTLPPEPCRSVSSPRSLSALACP